MAKPPRIYVESCPFIDLAKYEAKLTLESNRERNVWMLLKLLEAARNLDLELYTSMITVSECTHIEAGKPQPDQKVREFFDQLLMSGKSGVTLVQLTAKISDISRDLRWKDGLCLRGMDSIHLSTAIEKGCEELLTTDGQLKNCPKNHRGVSIIQAHETKQLPSKYANWELDDYAERKTPST